MKLFKIYLKKEWWWPLIYAIPVVFMNEGYIYPQLRFEFDFLSEPWTYVSFIFHYVIWGICWFFLFWKPNYLHQKNKAEGPSLPKRLPLAKVSVSTHFSCVIKVSKNSFPSSRKSILFPKQNPAREPDNYGNPDFYQQVTALG